VAATRTRFAFSEGEQQPAGCCRGKGSERPERSGEHRAPPSGVDRVVRSCHPAIVRFPGGHGK
jgi:hypothetical protein